VLTECQLSELVAHWSTWSTSQCDTADAVWSRSLVSRKAEVCPSGGIVSADDADRAGSMVSRRAEVCPSGGIVSVVGPPES